jgi:hypothetical protein
MSVATVLAIIGGIALFVGLLGGIEVKEIHIPRQPGVLRVTLAIIGIVFLGFAIFMSLPENILSKQSPTPDTATAIATEIPESTSTSQPELRQDEEPISIPHCVSLNSKARVAYTDGKPLSVRKSIGTSSSILTSLPEGTEFTIMEGPVQDGDHWWWKIVMSDGNTGWVAEGEADICFIEPLP